MSVLFGGIAGATMIVMALDPGKTTGYAVYHDEEIKSQGQCPTEMVWDLLSNVAPEVIIYETFQHRRIGNVDLTPVEVIGVLKEWARQHKAKLVLQSGQQAKHYWTNERVRELGAWVAAMPHAVDATRHLLYWVHFGRNKK